MLARIADHKITDLAALLRGTGAARSWSPAPPDMAAPSLPKAPFPRPLPDGYPDDLQVPALAELGRVVKPSGSIRLLEYVRPSGPFRRAIAKLWEPWVYWAYGASFDRDTEARVPQAGLRVVDSCFVSGDLVKMITVQTSRSALGYHHPETKHKTTAQQSQINNAPLPTPVTRSAQSGFRDAHQPAAHP